MMSERLAMDCFIVRIYRTDPENFRKIVGLVEMLDGSGKKVPFIDVDELGKIVNQRAAQKQPSINDFFLHDHQ